MSLDALRTSQAELILASKQQNAANIRENSDDRPRLQLRVPLTLTTAATAENPWVISNPSDGFYVESATDGDVYVKMSLTSPEAQNMLNYTKVKQNDSAEFSKPVRSVYLTWPAQSGKEIVLVFYLGISFKPGSMTSVISGGVVLTAGTGMTPVAAVSVTNAATALLSASTTRKKSTLQNLGGTDVYISGVNTVVATFAAGDLTGLKIPPGGTYEWINAGACYGITAAGTSIISINTEA